MSPSNQELLSRFGQNANLLTHMLNVPADQILLSELSEPDYKTASFLDQRIITPQLIHHTLPFSAVENLPVTGNLPPYYICHIGHVGSTLMSRFFGELPSILAVREPQILRDLAQISQIKREAHSPWPLEQYEARSKLILSWLSRSFHKGQRAMIKLSSFANEITPELIGPHNKSLFLYVSLPRYLQTILAGENSRQEANMLAERRLARLNKKLGAPLENLAQLCDVQKIALGWLCEMSTLMQTYSSGNQQNIYWLNFDKFLNAPKSQLIKTAEHFGITLGKDTAQNLISGPIMNSYSKAPQHGYSPDLRRDLLRRASADFAQEINQTQDWVAGLAKTHPLIETILTFSNQN